tara:strand:+ start:13551 stop:13715 length:165 start_codon:yes stop_codon:yes gene_type:complete
VGKGRVDVRMKKYLLLVEDEVLWKKFKESIQKDINSEILDLIKKKVEKEGKNEK